jgi:poly(3-hydroxybutyrate) depolymerase
MDRKDVTFASGGVDCAAWLYQPDGDGPSPLVVMAHGFSATREQRRQTGVANAACKARRT